MKLTLTSNGYTVAVLEDDELRTFHDIEFSLDYATQAEQDAQRGPGNWELIAGPALPASGCTRHDYRSHDEVKLLAAGRCRLGREAIWRSVARERSGCLPLFGSRNDMSREAHVVAVGLILKA